jgi:hypothetical protein
MIQFFQDGADVLRDCVGVSEDGAALLLLLLHGRALCACVFRDEECVHLHEVLQRNQCPCLMIVKILLAIFPCIRRESSEPYHKSPCATLSKS